MFISPYIYPLLKKEEKLSVERVFNVVSDYYNISVDSLKLKSRKAEHKFPRQICIYFIREKTDLPYTKIAKIFNHHHTSIIYTYTTMKGFIEINDKHIIDDVKAINNLFEK
jgi:chromosomal replication initiator protein